MNILLIDCSLGTQPEHIVREAHWHDSKGAFVPVQYFLQQAGENGHAFQPDVLIQKEHIGRRLLLGGLWELPCPKIFWSVDSHLNLYWQRFYCQLFDLVLTPHAAIFSRLPQSWHLPRVESFSCPGSARPWHAHTERSSAATFVGRIDGYRDQRQRFVHFLRERHGVEPKNLPYEEMLRHYDDTRILPNESICREFNFRIMEGASCGCCVLTEDIGPDLAANFEPGREVLTYRHVQDLDDELRFLTARPHLTENIGKAAQTRVLQCHLPEHRYQALLHIAADLAAHIPNSAQERRSYALACAQMARGNPACHFLLPQIQQQLEAVESDWQTVAMRLRMDMEAGAEESMRKLLAHLLNIAETLDNEDRLDALTTALSAVLWLQDAALTTTCCRLGQAMGQAMGQDMGQALSAGMRGNNLDICMRWAELLAATGRLCQPGFLFSDTGRQCPETAIEMLLFAKQWIRNDDEMQRWVAAIARMSGQSPLTPMALNYSAHHSLYCGSDWRVGLDYAFWNLRSYRLDEGITEVRIAHELALQNGEGEQFLAEASRLGIRLR